jgi:hypothetical protein
MVKLRSDPVTYQFYYQCPPQEGAPAKAAGFGWDPSRRRYYTEDPMVATALASRGDNYVKHLLADALEATASYRHPGRRRRIAEICTRSRKYFNRGVESRSLIEGQP